MVFLLESHLYLSLKALDSPLRNTSECCYTQWFSMSCRCPGPSYFNSLSTLKNCYKCAVYIKYTCKLLITYTFLNSIIRIIYLFLENFFSVIQMPPLFEADSVLYQSCNFPFFLILLYCFCKCVHSVLTFMHLTQPRTCVCKYF